MFTASHNPAQYNGIKLCRAGAAPVGEETGLLEIKAAVADGLEERAEEPGRVERRDLLPAVRDARPLVRRPGRARAAARRRPTPPTASAAWSSPRCSRACPFRLDMLFAELDGTFPNHPADPIQPENLADLQRAVLDRRCRRRARVRRRRRPRLPRRRPGASPCPGRPRPRSWPGASSARHPGETIVHNLICSKAVPEVIRETGGMPVRTRVGHSFIKQVMAETGAIFGGEHSAHYYFRDNYRADFGHHRRADGARTAVARGRPALRAAQAVRALRGVGRDQPRVDDPAAVIERVAETFATSIPMQLRTASTASPSTCGDWWFNLRPSNTEPLLRLNLEAADARPATRTPTRCWRSSPARPETSP